MRIMFMGTPYFAAESLAALCNFGKCVVAAVSQPDRPRGRGMEMQPTPVKEYADGKGIPVYQPEGIKGGELLPVLSEHRPDIIVVAAYGRILPEYVLSYPKYGAINIHASLLPKLRGAAPIQWAIICGDNKTGISIMKMEKGLDTGPVMLTRKIDILDNDTAESLTARLAPLGGEALVEALDIIEKGQDIWTAQDEKSATYASILKKAHGRVDWSKSATEIVNLSRGLYPWPTAYSSIGGKTFKILKAEAVPGQGAPGQVLGPIVISSGSGAVKINELQFENKRRMSAEEYLVGNSKSFAEGVVLD